MVGTRVFALMSAMPFPSEYEHPRRVDPPWPGVTITVTLCMTAPDRRAMPGAIPARVFRLGDEPGDDLSSSTTPEERLEMVIVLSRRMWELTGRSIPSYRRAEMPVTLVRRS